MNTRVKLFAKNLVSIKINQEIKLIIRCSDETASLFGPYSPNPPERRWGGVVERVLSGKFVGDVLPASHNPYPIQEQNLRLFCLRCGRAKDHHSFFVLENDSLLVFWTNIPLILT